MMRTPASRLSAWVWAFGAFGRLLTQVERGAVDGELVELVRRIAGLPADPGDLDLDAFLQLVRGDDIGGGPGAARRRRRLRLGVGLAHAVAVLVEDGDRGAQMVDGGLQAVPDGERALRVPADIRAVAMAVHDGEVIEVRRRLHAQDLASPTLGLSDDAVA